MKRVVWIALAVVASGGPGCTWYETVRTKLNEDGSKNGPIRAVLQGEYNRRALPSAGVQSMMPRDYYQ